MNSVQGKTTKSKLYHTREGYAALSIGVYPLFFLLLYFSAYDLISGFAFDSFPIVVYRVTEFFYGMQYSLIPGLLSIATVPFIIFISAGRLNRMGRKGTKLGWVGISMFLAAILALIIDNIIYYANEGNESMEALSSDILYPIMVGIYLLAMAVAFGISIYALRVKPKKLSGASEEAESGDTDLVAEAQKQGEKLTASAYFVYVLPSLLFVVAVLYAVINPFYGVLLDIDRQTVTEIFAPLFLIALCVFNYYTVKFIVTRKTKTNQSSKDSSVVKAMTSKLFQFKGRADGKELAKVSLYSLASFTSFFAAMNVLSPGFVFLIMNRPFLDIIMSYTEEGYEGVSQYFMVGLVFMQLLWATLALVSTFIRRVNDARSAK